MNEHSLVKSVHNSIKKQRCDANTPYFWKIKDDFQGGVADAFYCGPANDLWVEYKWIQTPKKRRDLSIMKDHKQQLYWLQNRLRNGRNATVVAGCSAGACFLSSDEWLLIDSKVYLSRLVSPSDLASMIVAFTSKATVPRPILTCLTKPSTVL